MDSAKYIGMDVHKESISIAVRNAAGLALRLRRGVSAFRFKLLSATSPANDNSTLQPKAVLMVVLAADREATAVAKPGVEIFGLYEA